LLDVYSGAGGAARGYQLAGFEVTGVDINPQPRYAGDHFVQADALAYLATADLTGFDAIHASPPCQDHSQLSRNYGAPSHGTGHLLGDTLEVLRAQPLPWIVENVVGAPMPSPYLLCGATFGLSAYGRDLSRHRLFSTSFAMLVPPCQHRRGNTIGIYGEGTNSYHVRKLGHVITSAAKRAAMGIDWMNRVELAQAVPPAYTTFIGAVLADHIRTNRQESMR
jgi:DNA (cytosine-5)-methyltransferase 1